MCRKTEGPPFHSVLTPSVPSIQQSKVFQFTEIDYNMTSIALQARKSKFLKNVHLCVHLKSSKNLAPRVSRRSDYSGFL